MIYKIKLKHDHGHTTVKIGAASEQEARKAICNMEKCPDRAIVSIKPIQHPGAASLRITLKDGEIRVFHGTDRALLLPPVEVMPGAWAKLFENIKKTIEEYAYHIS